MKVILGGLLGDLGDLPGDLGVLPGDLGVLPRDLGVLLFAGNIPPRLARFVRLNDFAIVLYMHIANIKFHYIALGSFGFGQGVNPNQIFFNQIIFQIRLVFSKFSIKLVRR
jgi:hypothetical protein